MTDTVWPTLIFQLRECTLDQSETHLEIAIKVEKKKKDARDVNTPSHIYLHF